LSDCFTFLPLDVVIKQHIYLTAICIGQINQSDMNSKDRHAWMKLGTCSNPKCFKRRQNSFVVIYCQAGARSVTTNPFERIDKARIQMCNIPRDAADDLL